MSGNWTHNPDVCQLVYDNAPVDDILHAWAYGDVKSHPPVAECVNVLVCFAVHCSMKTEYS